MSTTTYCHYAQNVIEPYYQQPFIKKRSLEEIKQPIVLHELMSECIHQIYFQNKKLNQLETFKYICNALQQRMRPNVSSSVMYQIIMGKVQQACTKVRELIRDSYRKLVLRKQHNNDMKHASDSWNVNFSKFRKATIQQNMNKVYGPIAHIMCTYHNSLIDCNKQVYDLWKTLYQYSQIKDLQFKTLQGNLNEIVLQELMREYPKHELVPREVMPMISSYGKHEFIFKEMWGFQKRKGVVRFQSRKEQQQGISNIRNNNKDNKKDKNGIQLLSSQQQVQQKQSLRMLSSKPIQKLSPPKQIPIQQFQQLKNPLLSQFPLYLNNTTHNTTSTSKMSSITSTNNNNNEQTLQLQLNMLQLQQQFANLDMQTRMRIFEQLYQFKRVGYQSLICDNDLEEKKNVGYQSMMRRLLDYKGGNKNKNNNRIRGGQLQQQQQQQLDQQQQENQDVNNKLAINNNVNKFPLQQQQLLQQGDILFNSEFHRKLLQSYTGPIEIQLQDDEDQNEDQDDQDEDGMYQQQYRLKRLEYQHEQMGQCGELKQEECGNININVNVKQQYLSTDIGTNTTQQTQTKYKQVLQQLKLINETFNNKFELNNRNSHQNNIIDNQSHHNQKGINVDNNNNDNNNNDNNINNNNNDNNDSERLPQLLPIDKNRRLEETLIEAKLKLTKMIQKQATLLARENKINQSLALTLNNSKNTISTNKNNINNTQLNKKQQQKQKQQLTNINLNLNLTRTDKQINILNDFHLQEQQQQQQDVDDQQQLYPDNFYQTLKKYYQPKQIVNTTTINNQTNKHLQKGQNNTNNNTNNNNDNNNNKQKKNTNNNTNNKKQSQSEIYFAQNIPGSALAQFISDKKSFSQTLQSLTTNNKLSSKLQKVSRQQIFDQIYQVAKQKQKRGHNLKMTYKKISYQLRGGEQKNQIKITEGSFTTDDLNWIQDLPEKTKYNLSESTDFGEKLIDQPNQDICNDQNKPQKKKKKKKKKKNKQKKQPSESNQNFDNNSVSSFNQDQEDLQPLSEFRKKSIYDIFKLRKTLGWSQGQSIQQYLQASEILQREKQQQLLMEKKIEIYQKTGQKNIQKSGEREKALSKEKKTKKQNYTEDQLKLFQFLQNLQIKDENRQKCVVTEETLQRIICKRKQIKSLEIFAKNTLKTEVISQENQKEIKDQTEYVKTNNSNPKISKPKNKKKKK